MSCSSHEPDFNSEEAPFDYVLVLRQGSYIVMILTGETEVLGDKHYTAWLVDEWMSMEQWWNDTDRGKLKYWEKNIIQCGR